MFQLILHNCALLLGRHLVVLQIAQLDGIDGSASALSNEADGGHGV